MFIAHFLVFGIDPAASTGHDGEFPGPEIASLATLPGVERVDRYEFTEFADDPYADDRQGQVLTIQTVYDGIASLERGLASETFQGLVGAVADNSAYTLGHEAMERVCYPVAGDTEPRELTAPISYVVRYHYPANDVQRFIEHYTSNHPQIEAGFPGIANVTCYLPIKWQDPTDLPCMGYMLGNEVVFESVQDLGLALTSPVMIDMRADFERFPTFHGHNTHYPMRRTRVA